MKMKIRYRSVISMKVLLSILFLMILCCCTSSAAVNLTKEELRQFGSDMMKQPDAPVSGDSLSRAQYLFGKYSDALAGKGVNCNLKDRFTFLFEKDRNYLACTEHLKNMQDIFEGGGVKCPDFLVGDKLKSGIGCIEDVNCNHVAVLVRNDDGRIYVFDEWMHAVQKIGTDEPYSTFTVIDTDKAVDLALDTGKVARFNRNVYGGGKESRFNGMKWEDWVTFCQGKGYIEFRLNGLKETAGRDLASIGALLQGTQKKSGINDCILCGGTKDCYYALKPFIKGDEPWKKEGSYEPYAKVYANDSRIWVEFHVYPYVDPCGDPTKIEYISIGPLAVPDQDLSTLTYAPLGWQPEARCNGVRLDQLYDLRSKKVTASNGDEFTDLCNRKPITNSVIWDTWFTYTTPTAS